jgi:glycine/D-amino acid oxidase-like deaminating enzyme/nitrite reductase/ring-hydroxylating ferredoxin subunit
MNIGAHAGRSVPLWSVGVDIPAQPPLAADESADVCVIGAGIAGLTTAYSLAMIGKKVIVLDDGVIAGGETERTTAHLVNVLDDRYFELERLHGEEGARLAAESHSAAIDRIERIVAEESISCDFERLDGYLFMPPGGDMKYLERELAAAQRAGLRDTAFVARAPLVGFDTGPSLRFRRQAQFHPLKYVAGLARAILERGGRIFTGTHAEAIRDGAPAIVETSGGSVTAGSVVVATNSPINERIGVHTKQAAYRTYVIGARVLHGLVPRALYWDVCQESSGRCKPGAPYHYVRLVGHLNSHEQSPYDVLVIGGEDHKTGQADDAEARYGNLESWARRRFPMMDEIEYRWSGQVLEPADSLAFIGRDPTGQKNVFIVTGDSGNGMTHGTIAGMLLADLITGRENPWAKLYDPSRLRLRAVPEVAKENLNAAAQLSDWVAPGEYASPDEVPIDTGGLVRRGLSKLAVYRDTNGTLYEMSAVCPHLKCIVAWNPTERTWDCPCHGSRFDAFGQVINGPANANLTPADSSALTPD